LCAPPRACRRRLDPAVVDGELLEVGEDAQRQLGRPGIAAELEGGGSVDPQIDRRLLGLDEELAHAANTERIVWCAAVEAHLDRVLVHHVLVLLRIAGGVVDVPAERREERVEKLAPHLSLVVRRVEVLLAVAREALDQLKNGIGCSHATQRMRPTGGETHSAPDLFSSLHVVSDVVAAEQLARRIQVSTTCAARFAPARRNVADAVPTPPRRR
jgi:hypothetical protein